jgi:hypothetical protein
MGAVTAPGTAGPGAQRNAETGHNTKRRRVRFSQLAFKPRHYISTDRCISVVSSKQLYCNCTCIVSRKSEICAGAGSSGSRTHRNCLQAMGGRGRPQQLTGDKACTGQQNPLALQRRGFRVTELRRRTERQRSSSSSPRAAFRPEACRAGRERRRGPAVGGGGGASLLPSANRSDRSHFAHHLVPTRPMLSGRLQRSSVVQDRHKAWRSLLRGRRRSAMQRIAARPRPQYCGKTLSPCRTP